MNVATQKKADAFEILFEEGLIGVSRARRFQMLERPGSPIRILRCLDIPGFSLPIVDPLLADPDYNPVFGPRVSNAVGIGKNDQALILAVATIEEDGPMANLRAPIVINIDRGLGVQAILDSAKYSLRAPVRVEV